MDSVRAAFPGAQVPVLAGLSTRRLQPIHAPARATAEATGAPAGIAPAVVANADIQVTYNGFSQAAHDSFEAAVVVWESMIVSSQVIHVNANWTPLSPGVLGSAGPLGYYLLDDDRVYPAALAEAVCSCNAHPNNELVANFNSNFTAWYLGTDGNPPSNKWDFFTVVLHELGHGLGFLSSFGVSGTQGGWGYSNSDGTYPLRYDEYEWNAAANGTRLTDTSAEPLPGRLEQLAL